MVLLIECLTLYCVKDFKMLPGGDLTLVGERGVTLSGGQKARTSLARCCWKSRNVICIDSCVCHVHVGRENFDVERFISLNSCKK